MQIRHGCSDTDASADRVSADAAVIGFFPSATMQNKPACRA